MKYYIEYPIPIRCGLKCPYCFHAEKWELEAAGKADTKYTETCPFTVDDFIAWRDKHLSDGTEFLYELQGGEMSYASNHEAVFEILDKIDGKFQLQSNGMGDTAFYRELLQRRHKIDRIGFTFHRFAVLSGEKYIDSERRMRFESNVLLFHELGIPVYVKELLFLDSKDDILRNKRNWEDQGVEFRIQDFKGYRGRDSGELLKYTADDWALIYPEYRHDGKTCHCREGYKQILIRGYDCFAGDVVACWNDLTVIGNIPKDTYTGYERVNILPNGGKDVAVQKKLYRGSYPYDFWRPGIEEEYKSLSKDQLNNPLYKEVIMVARYQERLDELNQNRQNVNREAVELQQLVQNCERRLKELNTEDVRLAAKAELLQELILAEDDGVQPIADASEEANGGAQ